MSANTAGDPRGRPRIHIARTLAEATRAEPPAPAGPTPARTAQTELADAPGVVTLPVAELASLRERAGERDRLLDQAQRARAELVNFRARTQKEREQWSAQARRELVSCVVGVLANFDRALEAEAAAESAARAAPGDSLGSFLVGMRLVREQLWKALADHGLAPIPAAALPFDPRVHEAVVQVPAPEGTAPGSVVTVFETGYTLEGQVVRPARVAVAAGPPAAAEPAAEAAPPEGPPPAPPAPAAGADADSL